MRDPKDRSNQENDDPNKLGKLNEKWWVNGTLLLERVKDVQQKLSGVTEEYKHKFKIRRHTLGENEKALHNMQKAMASLALDLENLIRATQPFGSSGARIDEKTFNATLNKHVQKALEKCVLPAKPHPELESALNLLNRGITAFTEPVKDKGRTLGR